MKIYGFGEPLVYYHEERSLRAQFRQFDYVCPDLRVETRSSDLTFVVTSNQNWIRKRVAPRRHNAFHEQVFYNVVEYLKEVWCGTGFTCEGPDVTFEKG